MTTKDFTRKLTAILSADVKGYSRLMQEDEEATVRTITAYREVMTDHIQGHDGRVVDAKGDNVLAEFPSVVDAVRCGLAVQKELKEKNDKLPESKRMEFRIGINLGDVIEEGDTIYGDGVNIAARLESLSEGGGICISGTAFDQIGKKLTLGYEFLGEQTVKNIDEPVRVYKVLMEPEAAGKVIGQEKPKLRQWRWAAIGGVVVLIVVTGILTVWHHYLRPQFEPASVERMAFPLPEKPSIAVLPFVNMSEDPKQEYFSDGITEDLITDLSKISGLFVIARNSVFQYKHKIVDIKRISSELGVRYLLEGSVRRVEDKVRINAQLIDATTGGHLWAERYDGITLDIFALQDRITRNIVAALAVKLTGGEEAHVSHKETNNILAYDTFLQGWAHYVRFAPDDFAKAIPYFEKAINMDPQYGRAYAALASIYWESFYRFWHTSLGVAWRETKERADEYLKKAMENPTPLGYLVASKMLISSFEHEKAIAKAELSIALDPNDANGYIAKAYTLVYAGRPKEAFDFIQKAIRLNPQYPAYYLFVLGLAHFGVDRFEEAAASFERAIKRNPENYVPLIPLASAYAHLNREQEAIATIEKLRKVLPTVTVSFVRGCPLWRYKNPRDKKRLLGGLKKAGLPSSIYETLRKTG